MELYLKQKVFSWGDKFTVFNADGSERYVVHGEVFTMGKKLHVCDLNNIELAYIHQKVLSFLPKYFISRRGEDIAQVVKQLTFLRQEYTVSGFNWEVKGDFWAHEYQIISGGNTIATVSKKWLTWGDSYEISIAPGVDDINALCVVLIIDACIAAQQQNSTN